MLYEDLTKEEQSIYRRLDRVFKDMAKAHLSIFIDDGTLRVFRGDSPPMTRKTGEELGLDNEQSIMDFNGTEHCAFDGGSF